MHLIFNKAFLYAQIEQLAHMIYALAVHYLELSLTEWWRYLVFYNFYSSFIPNYFIALLDTSNSPNVQSNGTIEFQRITPGSCLRIS